MVAEKAIIIHKADLLKHTNTDIDLFKLHIASDVLQTYSGVYNFETIAKIIDGFKPFKIIVYCNQMHASTIVKIIFTLQMRKYPVRIHRLIINNDKQ